MNSPQTQTSGNPNMAMPTPQGGFSKNIGGRWKCDTLGTLTLVDQGGNVTGTYTVKGGKVTGTVEGNNFTGTWQERGQAHNSGNLTLQSSIRTMTNKPTHLEGTKTTSSVMGGNPKAVNCKR
ncbi:MAG: hypothetical protein J0L53_13920 [Spirochaetes bacterium]|nr:hypothetical protein [Spirochaetota bacterium]